MKKSIILIFVFLVLISSSAFAGTFSSINTDNITPKNKISDNKNTRKIKTIQKLLNTKIGKKIEKLIIKKTLKKLQKQASNPQKSRNKKDNAIFVLSILFLLGGIGFIIGGGTLIGIIFIIIGLILLSILAYFISLLGSTFIIKL